LSFTDTKEGEKMKIIQSSAITALGLMGLLLSGCATLGPVYKPEQSVPSDKGTVYIYRESKMVGAAIGYTVSANGTPVAKLSSGSYFVYHALPDEVAFSAQTEAKTSVTIDIKAGEVYYLKGTVGMGVLVGHPHLVLVSADVGQSEITACKLVPEGPLSVASAPVADLKQK
jgi:uncharacterized protein DUF2846